MAVKFTQTTSANLENVPLENGQIIAVRDTQQVYMDYNFGNGTIRKRYSSAGSLTDGTYTAALPTLTADDTFVVLSNIVSGNKVTIGDYTTASAQGTAIGSNVTAGAQAVAIGANAQNTGTSALGSVALGYMAKTTASGAIQIGTGTNTAARTMQIRGFTVLDADGIIPAERLPDLSTTYAVVGHTHENYTLKWTSASLSGTAITLSENDRWQYSGTISALTIALDVPEEPDTFCALASFGTGSTAPTITATATGYTVKMAGIDCLDGVFTPYADMRYTIAFYYDGVNIVGRVSGYSIG